MKQVIKYFKIFLLIVLVSSIFQIHFSYANTNLCENNGINQYINTKEKIDNIFKQILEKENNTKILIYKNIESKLKKIKLKKEVKTKKNIIINYVYCINKRNFEYFELTNFTSKLNNEGIKFLQNYDEGISIIDINLDFINLSFGGVNINFEKSRELTHFSKYKAKNFKYKSIENKNVFAFINGQFFNPKITTSPLSFPLKSDGKIISNYMDNDITKRTFVLDDNQNAKIFDGYKDVFLSNTKYKELIVAFNPGVNAQRYRSVGRTYIGVKNEKNIIFFIANNKTQKQMDVVLSNYGIEEKNVIMMDGGSSTQFAINNSYNQGENFEQFYGTGKVPHFFMIYKD